jgi:hypothetical protein
VGSPLFYEGRQRTGGICLSEYGSLGDPLGFYQNFNAFIGILKHEISFERYIELASL